MSVQPIRIGAVVLAAGTSSRFGRQKMLARLGGRPVLQHVLDVAGSCGFAAVAVVLGHEADTVRAAVEWRDEVVVWNPRPEDGLSSSLRVGVGALDGVEPPVSAAFIFLGDQPLTRSDVVAALVARLRPDGAPLVVPRYAEGGGGNPVLVRRDAWPLVAEASGDRGLGPLIRQHPELVAEVPVPGSNPDVDTPEELAALEATLDAGE